MIQGSKIESFLREIQPSTPLHNRPISLLALFDVPEG